MTADPCPCCRKRPVWACGWCLPCWKRWDRAGRPENGPPAPMSHQERCALSNAARKAAAARTRAAYARLRVTGYTPAQAALRLGMAERTGELYESAYRAAGDLAATGRGAA